MQALFVDVMIPVKIPQFFTYRVPAELAEAVQVGMRLVVQFGPRKVTTAIAVRLHGTPPANYEAKYILDVLDETPTVNALHLEFWQWMASYYLCTPGEVMTAALPSGLKISSESRLQINPTFSIADHQAQLSDKELLLLETLEREDSLSYTEVAELLQVKSIYQTLKYLVAKQAIILYEAVKEQYTPKRVRKVRVSAQFAHSEQAVEELFSVLANKPKQEDVLLKYVSLVPIYAKPELNAKGVLKSELLAAEQVSPSSLSTLIKNGYFEEFEVVVSRLAEYEMLSESMPTPEIALSGLQKNARDRILSLFEKQDTVLLHGITGSGKTEIYIDLISKVVESGGQALMLLPEIALTTQIVLRLKKVFGNHVGIYHSKFSDNERVEVWRGVAEGRFSFVVGVRSAIFLPFTNLGLIIVDEEHETSYKQHDPAPRYHARDSAMMLARMHHAKVLLGSATPAVETYYHALAGRYGLVKLTERYGEAQLPTMQVANLRQERKQKTMKGEFSSALVQAIEACVAKGEQAILFQNRRGYAPYLNCEACGWIPECHSCSVKLTYHLYRGELRCHYCGHKEPAPRVCVACGSSQIKMVGVGTERIEDELKLLLPNIIVQRMDLDTTRSKHGYQNIIADFEAGRIHVLVGTQMVTKGLDFDKVGLVGVFDVDRMLHFPDFRSHERAFQLVMQVSGRAGRRKERGQVILQTAYPEHPLVVKMLGHDYEAMYAHEIAERESYGYPPFTRVIRLAVRTEDPIMRDEAADQLAVLLREKLGNERVLGPEYPVVDKIRNYYLKDLLIKLERNRINLSAAKQAISECMLQIVTDRKFKRLDVVADVDFL